MIIAASSNSGIPIMRVSASSGQATPVTALARRNRRRWPQFLPDGKHFLYERVSSDPAKAGVYVGSIDAQAERAEHASPAGHDRQAYYAPSAQRRHGSPDFLARGHLDGATFDPSKLTLSGEPAAIADGVDSYAARNYGLFSVSNTGTLVYRGGGSGTQPMPTWFDRQGNAAGTLGHPATTGSGHLSDGSRVAVAIGPAPSRDIWILDVARGTNTRFTFDPARDDYPAWTPDGKNIAFSSNRGGQMDLYIKPADGSGEEKLLLKTAEQKYVESWTKDGRFLLFDSEGRKTGLDIWALPFRGRRNRFPFCRLSLLKADRGCRRTVDGWHTLQRIGYL